MKVEDIARVCHEANRQYCKTIGDDSQPTWDTAADWQKRSCIAGVSNVLANPDITPEQNHKNWMTEREAAGWNFGPFRDPERKEHPCILPWDKLPIEEKQKDSLFIFIVRALAHKQALTEAEQANTAEFVPTPDESKEP